MGHLEGSAGHIAAYLAVGLQQALDSTAGSALQLDVKEMPDFSCENFLLRRHALGRFTVTLRSSNAIQLQQQCLCGLQPYVRAPARLLPGSKLI